jgi:protein tyrosine/serine phosphatase
MQKFVMFTLCVTIVAFAMLICAVSGRFGYDAVSGATVYEHDPSAKMPPPSDTYEVLGQLEGLKSYAVKYDDYFYRGGEFFSEDGPETLRKLGIRTIISITPNDMEREAAREYGFNLVEMDFSKKKGLTEADLEKLLETFENDKGPVYIHCHGGTHRGGILGMVYRVHRLGWKWEKALMEFGRLGGSLRDDHIMLESIRKTEK